jgi:hypothetical protein
LDFVTNPRSIKLGLALDGVNPYVDLSTNHSTWQVLLFIYNLPPWLTTKCLFVILALIIPRKEYVKNENINVYLQQLLEELEMLWVGVMIIDVIRPEGSWPFCLRAICMWNIHDFPTYGLFVGCHVKGYMACPLCILDVDTRCFSHLKKMYIKGINVTLGETTHIGEIVFPSMDN